MLTVSVAFIAELKIISRVIPRQSFKNENCLLLKVFNRFNLVKLYFAVQFLLLSPLYLTSKVRDSIVIVKMIRFFQWMYDISVLRSP